MKEKISKIMRSGGYAVIIAVIAMAAYLFILRMGDKFLTKQAVPLEIKIDKNGYLYTNYGGDKKGVYILWQVDGGNIIPVEKNEELSKQYYEGNKWYYAYTGPDEKIKWSSNDYDGNKYTTVTIRATIYFTSSDKEVFYIGNYINEASITITEKNNNIVKTEDRLFSNPVREGNKNWSQIYEVSSDNLKTVTYMYRTGYDIENPEDKILVWEADENILNQTELRGGVVGEFMINAENSGKNILTATPLITFNPENVKDKLNVTAYLTNKENSEKKAGEIKEKFYETSIIYNKE